MPAAADGRSGHCETIKPRIRPPVAIALGGEVYTSAACPWEPQHCAAGATA